MIEFKKTAKAVEFELANEGLDFSPYQATSGSNGYDLKACVDTLITIFQMKLLNTYRYSYLHWRS